MWKKILSLIVVMAFLLPQTTIFAAENQIDESVSRTKENNASLISERDTLSATDQSIKIKLNNTALIATDQSIKINTAIANINSNVYSYGNFEYTGSQLTLSKDCNTVGKCIVNSDYAQINKINENVNKLKINNFSDKIKMKLSNDHINIEENSYQINSNSILKDMTLKGDLSAKSSTLNINSYIIAKRNIDIESSLITSNKDNPFILVSENGNIDIAATDSNLSGIIYAPNGTVTINSANTNINGIIIAQNIVVQGSNCTVTDNPICTQLFESFLLTDMDKDGLDDDYESNCLLPHLYIYGEDIETIEDINPLVDFDGDGLNYIEEYEINTNPFKADSDLDGLNDKEEVEKYHTNPTHWDTDGDTMSDGTEISCELNPLECDTDGNNVLDCDETLTQIVRLDPENKIKIDESLVVPEVKITGKGDFSTKLSARDINDNKALTLINSVVGHPFELEHKEDLQFESSTVGFKLSDQVLKENKIEDLAIAWYDYENNNLVLLDTKYDAENKKISASTDHFSTFVVINYKIYFVDIDYENKSEILKNGKADIVFAIDTTGSMGGAISRVKSSVSKFVDELKINKVNVRLGLVEYKDITSDGYFSTKDHGWFSTVDSFKTWLNLLTASGGGDWEESSVDALNTARNTKFRNGVNKYIIMITDAPYKNGTRTNPSATMESEIVELKLFNYKTSVITLPQCYLYYNNLVNSTGGIMGNINNNFNIELQPLIEKIGEEVNDGAWVRLTNGSVVKLAKDPSLGDKTIDTDKDGICDLDELKFKMTVQVYHPGTQKIESFDSWAFKSDPSKEDTDGDGYKDPDDKRPTISDVEKYEISKSEYVPVEYNGPENGTLPNEGYCKTEANYGGNQSWFYDSRVNNDAVSERLENGGCGLISASDTLIYLAQSNINYKSLANFGSVNGTVTYADYNNFVRTLGRDYLTPFDTQEIPIFIENLLNDSIPGPVGYLYSLFRPFKIDCKKVSDMISSGQGTWGIFPPQLIDKYDKYLRDNGIKNLKMKYASVYSFKAEMDYLSLITPMPNISIVKDSDKLMGIIRASLQNDKPVPILIGPMADEVDLYTVNKNAKLPLQLDIQTKYSSASSHYVTITGLVIDEIDGKTKLVISNWGSKNVIDFSEFMQKGDVFSGIFPIIES